MAFLKNALRAFPRKLGNKKAQIEIVALAFMVAGVITVAAAGLLSTGGGARVRADFEQAFVLGEARIGEAETFYSSVVNKATRNVLAADGYDLNNFCPASVNSDQALKDKIIDESGKLVSQYADYSGIKLPPMKTDTKEGVLNILPVGEGTITKGYGQRYESVQSVELNFDAEYYATQIAVTAERGGESPFKGPINVEAFSAAGDKVCSKSYSLSAHERVTDSFACNGKVKKIKASTDAIHFVDEFTATIHTPSLSYLKITGTPAEGILLKNEQLSMKSDGYFSTQIPSTVHDAKPDIAVDDIILSSNAITIGSTVKISTHISNKGCAEASEFKLQILNSTNIISETKLGGFQSGGTFGVSDVEFKPAVVGTYSIIVKADPENKVPELSESNNEKTVQLTVDVPKTKSCSEVGGQCTSIDSCVIKGGKAVSGSCGNAQAVCCKK